MRGRGWKYMLIYIPVAIFRVTYKKVNLNLIEAFKKRRKPGNAEYIGSPLFTNKEVLLKDKEGKVYAKINPELAYLFPGRTAEHHTQWLKSHHAYSISDSDTVGKNKDGALYTQLYQEWVSLH